MSFFDVCVRCKTAFTDQAAFNAHMAAHKDPGHDPQRGIKEAEEQVKLEAQDVPETSRTAEDDAAIAEAKKFNFKRKKLVSAGIEAQTMTRNEVEARYEEEKKKGTVK